MIPLRPGSIPLMQRHALPPPQTLLAGIGTLGLSGQPAGLLPTLTAAAGSFGVTGNAAAFQWSAAPLTAARGTFTLTGEPATLTQGTFPLAVSADSRTLVTAAGSPFPILGRASWDIVALNPTNYASYLSDTTGKGFNTIECFIPAHHPRCVNPPFNFNGDLPFLKRLDGANWSGSLSYANANNEAPDFTTPNSAYWTAVDSLVSYCLNNSILMLFFPAYLGFNGGDQGWMVEMVANGQSRMQTYGSFISSRYANYPNIVWMLGGDYSPSTTAEKNAETGLITGLTSGPTRFYAAEWNDGQNGEDNTDFASTITLNSMYSFSGNVAQRSRTAYQTPGTEPAFALEYPYDESGPDGTNINSAGTQPIRRYNWWAFTCCIGGYVGGNENVWPFQSGYTSHLNTQTAGDCSRQNAFIQACEWWKLVPSGLNGMKTLITAGGSSSNLTDYVSACAKPDGKLLLAYVPPAHSGTITVDMTAMSGNTRGRWWNPTTAAYTDITGGSFNIANTGTHVFTPPGDNGTGFTDWLLVLDA